MSGLCVGILYVIELNLKLSFDVSEPSAQTLHPALYFHSFERSHTLKNFFPRPKHNIKLSLEASYV